MMGLRLRKGRNLPEVMQLVRGELGFMLRLCDLLGQASSLPPSLWRVWVGGGCRHGSGGGFYQKATSPECRKQPLPVSSVHSQVGI